MKSAGKPGNGSPKPDGSRMQALYPKVFPLGVEPRKINFCGLMITSGLQEVKADGLWNPEGSRPESVMASIQFTTGVLDHCMHSKS